MYIPNELIDQVRHRVRIEDIVQKYVPTLRKKGKNYSGLCPFHKETLPSFTVSPDKQIFYCFGCHAGGNVFSFVSKIERLDFPESVRHLADIVGVEITEKTVSPEKTAERNKIRDMLKFASDIYHKNLLSGAGSRALEYLNARGLSEDSVKQFGIGFAPDSWSFLTDRLTQNSYDLITAEKSGIIGVSDKSSPPRYYDKFRNRVIFPINDISGNVIAFGGRVTDDSMPKYINSSESDFFRKRDVLFGLDKAKNHIKELDRAVVVEGYLDVIGAFQFGIKNCVAPLGTALTAGQFSLLSRYCSEAVLLFDADSAGLKAALKSIEVTREVNIDLRIAILPEDDPFDFLLKHGARELLAVIDSAMNPVDFRIEQVMKSLAANGEMKTLLQLFEIIKPIRFETERARYLKIISDRLNIDENAVRADFYNYYLKNRPRETESARSASVEIRNYIDTCYRDIIAIICFYPDIFEKVIIDLASEVEDIHNVYLKNIIVKMIEIFNAGEQFSPDKLFDFFPEGSEIGILNEIMSRPVKVENPVGAFTESYINLKQKKLDDLIDKYSEYLVKNNSERFNDYILEIDSLKREKIKLNDYNYNKTIGI